MYEKLIIGLYELKQKYLSIEFMKKEGLLNQVIVKNLNDEDTIELQNKTIYNDFKRYHIKSIHVNLNKDKINELHTVIEFFERATNPQK